MSSNIRMLLADDQSLLRATFRILLETVPGIEIAAEARDGSEAVAEAIRHRPDVVLMDIRMPGLDGIEATRIITGDERLSGVKVLILTTFETDEHVAEALRAGASGFVGKGINPQELIDAIRTVAAGDSLLSPAATRSLINRFLAQDPPPRRVAPVLESLTPREREVVVLVATGLSNDEIAAHLGISAPTAKTHVNRAMAKLHVRDRAQVVIAAYQGGLVRP
jgi:DNA-binding NarL/FixJ family response regulator